MKSILLASINFSKSILYASVLKEGLGWISLQPVETQNKHSSLNSKSIVYYLLCDYDKWHIFDLLFLMNYKL